MVGEKASAVTASPPSGQVCHRHHGPRPPVQETNPPVVFSNRQSAPIRREGHNSRAAVSRGRTRRLVRVWLDAHSTTATFPVLSKVASKVSSGENARDLTGVGWLSVVRQRWPMHVPHFNGRFSPRIASADGQPVARGRERQGSNRGTNRATQSSAAWWSSPTARSCHAPVCTAITFPSWEMATSPMEPELVCSLTDSSGWQSCHR